MYDINIEFIKTKKLVIYSVLAVGIVMLFIIIGCYIYNLALINNYDGKTMSKMVIVNEQYHKGETLYYFDANEEEYICYYNGVADKSNQMVYYDSKNPTHCLTEKSIWNWDLLLFAITPIGIIVLSIYLMIYSNKEKRKILELNETGKLVKNYPFNSDNVYITGKHSKMIETYYSLSNGRIVRIRFKFSYYSSKELEQFTSKGTFDFIIDENNPNKYFADFEINRIGGNLSTDYYNN